jgi:hypothetical protein
MPDKFIINPSPKNVVLADKKWCEAHRSLIQSPVLTNSVNSTLLEYQRSLINRAKDGNEAAAAHYKMSGALEFVNLFKNLAEPVDIVTKPQQTQNLTH